MTSSAIISPDDRYRYLLERTWGNTLWEGGWGPIRRVLWCLLNPSTADATVDDATVRRCVRFSRDWGYGGLAIVNLYAYRATNPKTLTGDYDNFGPENDHHIATAALHSHRVVLAWGASPVPDLAIRAQQVIEIILEARRGVSTTNELYCLGLTAGGHPRHPLYLAADTPLVPYLCRRAA